MRQLIIVAMLGPILALALGCAPAPPPGENPDDVVTTPGGLAYRANVHEQGVENPWPPIQTSTLVLGDNVTITYRANIETKAGEARNNIFSIYGVGLPQNPGKASLKAVNLPTGIEVTESEFWLGPRRSETVLKIEISQNVKRGEYSFGIGVEINERDYGKLPCTIKVVPD